MARSALFRRRIDAQKALRDRGGRGSFDPHSGGDRWNILRWLMKMPCDGKNDLVKQTMYRYLRMRRRNGRNATTEQTGTVWLPDMRMWRSESRNLTKRYDVRKLITRHLRQTICRSPSHITHHGNHEDGDGDRDRIEVAGDNLFSIFETTAADICCAGALFQR